MGKGLFVVGTGTDVGKTFVTGLIIKKMTEAGYSAGYYKAAVSGNIRDDSGKLIAGDPMKVKKMSNLEQDIDGMCPYVYERAVSPHLASRIEGNPVNLNTVIGGYKAVAAQYDYVTMEGSGGILCPIRFDEETIWLEDIIEKLGLPCLLIADAGLGTINQVGLTCHYMKSKGLEVRGIIFNHYHEGDVMEEDNVKMCSMLTDVPVVGYVADNGDDLVMDIKVLEDMYCE